MRFKILIILIAFIFLFYGILFAAKEAQVGARIGLINIQKILMESKAGKETRASFEKEIEGKRAVLQTKEKEVKQLEDDLKAASAKLKADARKTKEENFTKELKELRRLKQDMEDELKKKDSELTSKILKEIFDITKKLGEERQYTVIMQAGPQVIYGERSADITDEVIKRYDNQYKGR